MLLHVSRAGITGYSLEVPGMLSYPHIGSCEELSADQWRTIVDRLPQCVGIYSAIRDGRGEIVDFRVEYVNDAVCRTNQIPKEQQIGERLNDVLPGHRESGLFGAYCAVVETGRPFVREGFEYRDVFGGRLQTWAFDIRADKFGDGFVATWEVLPTSPESAGQDRAKRQATRQAVQALRESEGRLRLAAEATGFGTYDYDVQTRRSTWSQRAQEIIGISAAGPVDPVEVLLPRIHPGDRDFLLSVLNARDNSGRESYVGEYRIVLDDGGVRWLRDTGRVIFDEGADPRRAVRMIGTLLDVTEQKQAEQALRESEERYRATFDRAPVGIAHCGLDGRWLRFNDAVCRITGYSHEELKTLTFADITHPDDLEADWAQARRLFAGELSTYTMEKRYIRKDGGAIWVNLTASMIRDDAGRPLHSISVIEDIADRKRHEEQIRTVMAELNHRVKNTLATVDAIAQQTLHSARSLEQFRESFGARLRSMSAAHALLTRSDWVGAELRELFLAELQARVGSPEHLVLDGPYLVIQPEPALALHLAVHELATNASKYGALSTPAGRLAVRWWVESWDEPRLEIVWQEQGGPKVAGRGEAGFGSQLIVKLVEYQLGGVFERRFVAEGLRCRLSVPLERVAHDAPLRGGASRASRGEVNEQRSRAAESARRLRVLIVEDNASVVFALEAQLELCGCTVVGSAGTLETATGMAEETAFDMALLDVNLKDKDVYPLARTLRSRGVPFALMTGFNAEDLPAEFADTPIFSKPMDPQALENWVRELQMTARD